MSHEYHIGELCVGHSFVRSTERNGDECIVQTVPVWHDIVRCCKTREYLQPGWYQLVRWTDGMNQWCRPENLRRKKLPPQRTVPWSALANVWQPKTTERVCRD